MQPKDVQPTAWERVREFIDAGDAAGVAAAVAALDGAGRRAVAHELPGHVAVARARAERLHQEQRDLMDRECAARRAEVERLHAAGRFRDEEEYRGAWAATWHRPWWRLPPVPDWTGPMRVAGAGVIGGAAAAAAWINRGELGGWDLHGDPAAAPLLTAITARPVAWQADLAVRLALRVRDGRRSLPLRDGNLPLALALLRRTGVTPPEHDPLVAGWVSLGARLGELRTDPLLDHFLPRIFEAEGVGRVLRGERPDAPRPDSWLGALCALAAEGRVDRALLLGGCRRRFLRGGEGPDLRFFAHLHELLAPSPAEIGPHAVDYLRLLPTAPALVAESALRHLRRLPGLDPEDVAEALEGLLFRAETGLVRAGLSWWDEAVRRAPGRADAFAPALAAAFGHQARAVQERAVRLAVRHAGRFTPLGAEALRAAVEPLPPASRDRLAAVIGGEPAGGPEPGTGAGTGNGAGAGADSGVSPEEEVFVPRALPAPVRPVPLAGPPDTPGYLADLYPRGDWQAAERCLAAFVRLAARDRESLRACLAPLAGGEEGRLLNEEWREPGDWMTALAAELASHGRAYTNAFTAFSAGTRRGLAGGG
ncbi:DUF6493 family protein, partial [Planomonospora corallina]